MVRARCFYLPCSSREASLTHALLGHGQSGQFFQCKTRFMRQYMEQTVLKALQRDCTRQISSIEFYYPSGQLPADPESPDKDDDRRAWGYGDPETEHIEGLEESVQYVSDILERHGPFIGIMGFSTGACLAAIVTSLLEKRRSICSFNFTVSITCPRILRFLLVTYVFWFLARSPPDGVCYLPDRVSASTG
jgi:hypothetical protein